MQLCRRAVVFCVVLLCASVGRAAERQVLRDHVPAALAGLIPVDRLPATQPLHLAISLPLRNRESLASLLKQLYDPASPSFHRFLSSEQFTAAFGPTKEDYQAVVNFARSNSLTVTATRDNRALLEVGGSVANIEKAFHVSLRVYPHPTERRNFYAPDAEPSLDLDVPVLAIAGLTDFLIPHPASLHVRPLEQRFHLTPEAGSASGLYIGQDFRGAYAQGVTNTGAGQSVGLVEFDSYYAADITNYLNTPGAGFINSNVTLSNVVLGSLSGPPGSGNTEVALDIDMAISMAPGLSTVYIYEATNTSAEPDAVLSRMASDNLSRQLSCSWTGFSDAGIEQAFLEFAAQGQSFFQASGDSGEYNPRRNPVEPPSDDTNVTSVGGTTLSTSGPKGNWVSETTWNWFTQPEDGLSANATSGGVSPTYALPAWQTGIDMSANQGSTSFRNLPDVSMVADEIFLIANNGGDYFVGGTSAAAPLWAGLTALVNQQRAAQEQPSEGFINPALYGIGKGANYSSCFHDITVGNNTNSYSSKQFFAVAGYDLCTGWGTPIGARLINVLSPEPLQITPSTGVGFSGPYGGPFSGTNQNFTLTNVATTSFNWALGIASPWLSASSSGGTLVSGGPAAIVSVGPNSTANSLAVGAYTNTVSIPNLNDAVAQNFQFILTVSQAAPSLAWASPASMTYGTALSASQLDATANVPGRFAYTPANDTVLNGGTNVLSVIFTPTDTVDYSSATNTVSLVISPAPLTVTAANTNRAYGQVNPIFTGTITGVTNGDNITAAYSCSATTASPVGMYPIVPSLTDPNNRQSNYAVSLADGTLTVRQVTLIMTWSNPAPIIYGTSLTSNQLNATANVPGSFNYSPTNGTVLTAGTNVLSVIFIPTDTVDYSSATNTVSVVISPAPLTVTAANTNRAFGQANPIFTGAITGVTNGDNITGAYSCSATTGSPAGLYPIVPSLTDPNNRQTNYTVSLLDGTLTVSQAFVAIIWSAPAPITYGASLASNQLNATASVPGSFAYSPTNGTVLTAGTNVLSVIFTPTDAVDYSSATNTVSVVISPALLTVTAANTNRSFGQANPIFTGAITGVTNGDNITAAYSCSATTGSPVGMYPIVPSLTDPNNRQTNYTVSLLDGTLTVGQAVVTIIWSAPAPITYGASLASNQLNATANVPGSFAYSPTNGTVLTAGTNVLSVIFTPIDPLDYNSTTNTVSLVISPAPLTVTAANTNRTFGQANPIFTGTVTGVTNGDNITAVYSCSANTGSPVGTYPIVPSLADPNDRQTNYTVSLLNGTLTVGQAVVTIIWSAPAPITYGASLASNQLNAMASVPGSFAYSPTNGAVLNAGTNVLSVIFTPTDTVDYSSTTNTVSVVISPAPLTVTAANTNRSFGQANPIFAGTITGVANGDNITSVYSCSANTGSPVGTYPIVPSLADPIDRETNYTVSLLDGTLTVGQAFVTIIWSAPAPITYGASLASNQLNATANVPGNFAYSPTNGTVLTAGTNVLSVIFTPTDTVDYSSATNTVSVVISPAPLTVTAANTNRAFGQANPIFTGTITGVANGDNITAVYSCSANTGSPVGTYPIVPSLADPIDRQTNYTVSLLAGTLTVGQAFVAIIWSAPAPITYGTSLASNQLNATANVPGSFAYSPTNGAVLNAGTNVLSVIFTPTDTVDYSSTTNTVSVVISPAPLTVTAANTNRAFGQANPIFTGTITGVTNGDNITAVYSCSANTGSPVGTYPIVPSLADPIDRQTNYTVSLLDGTLTVGQAVVTIIWTNPAPITYGTSLASNQLNATANVPGSFAYSPTNGTVLNAGTNVLSVTFTSTDTVDFSSATDTVSVVISPAPLTVTAGNTNRAFGQANPIFTGTITGVTNGDNITAVYSCSANTGSPVGTYPIVPSLADPIDRQTNYTVSLLDGTLTVSQAVVAIIWSAPAPITYGTSLASNQLNATANVPGSFAYSPTNGAVLSAGTNVLSVIFTPTDTVDFSSVTNTVSLVISPAPLLIASGITADSKVYNGTTATTLSFNNVGLAGVVSEDAVSLNTNLYAANFTSANVGHGIAVTVSGLTLNGASADNYTLTQPETLVADITSPSLQVAASLPNIVISWTTNATVYVLRQTASLIPPVTWSPVTNSIMVNGTNNTVLINASSGVQYFELIGAK